METTWWIVGWVLWGFAFHFGLGGFLYNIAAARRGGFASKAGIFQFAALLSLAALFLASDLSKLHLAWLIPACWVISLSPIGTVLGSIIGHAIGCVVPLRRR